MVRRWLRRPDQRHWQSPQQFTSDDVWQQIRLAYEQNYTDTGSKIADALGQVRPDQSVFDTAASTPPLYLARGVGRDRRRINSRSSPSRAWRRNDPAMAAASFSSVAPALTPSERAIGWGTIAYQQQ